MNDYKIEPAVENCNYNNQHFFYFEVLNDGTVNRIHHKIADVNNPKEHSIVTAYLRAKDDQSKIFFACLNEYGNPDVVRVDDLEALADSFGIVRKTSHIHDIAWKFNETDDGKDRQAKIDIRFKCGCTIGEHNKRIMVKELCEQKGWRIFLNSIPYFETTECTIRLERNSITK